VWFATVCDSFKGDKMDEISCVDPFVRGFDPMVTTVYCHRSHANTPDEAPNQKNWHYPANFEGAVGDGRSKRRGKGAPKENPSGDRFERARRARSGSSDSHGTYPPRAATDDDVPDWGRDYGSKGRRSSKSSRNSGSGSYDGAPARKQDTRNSDDVFNHQF
jgi:hypothetical protein